MTVLTLHTTASRARGRHRRAVALAVVVALAAATGACGGGDEPDEAVVPATGAPSGSTAPATTRPATAPDTTAPATTATTPPRTAPPSTAPPATAPPTTVPPATPGTLASGDSGPAVLDLQRRLASLGYWPGAEDGTFGQGTHHAVVALQKAAGLGRDGIVGPATRRALDQGIRPAATSGSGHVIEIDLARQLLLVVQDGRVDTTFDTSTGSVAGTTPVGQWTVTREIDGFRQSRLGLLYRPKYFYEGVAVHGYTSVPPYPASHGCVRVTYAAMDRIWALGLMPVGTTVVVR
jgi:peptidoglycan hydrolase-like protein with peptidoglycan-binding domain